MIFFPAENSRYSATTFLSWFKQLGFLRLDLGWWVCRRWGVQLSTANPKDSPLQSAQYYYVLLMIRRYFWKSMRRRERLHQIVWYYVISIWIILTCFKWRHMLFIATSWWHTHTHFHHLSILKAQEAVEEVRLRGCFAWSRRDLQEVAAGARWDWTGGGSPSGDDTVGWFEIARWRRAKVSCLEPPGSTWLGSLIKLLGKTGETLWKIWKWCKNV